MPKPFRRSKARQALTLLLSFAIWAAPVVPVFAAEQPEEEIELKRSDINDVNPANKEAKDEGGNEKPATDEQLPLATPNLLKPSTAVEDEPPVAPDISTGSSVRTPFNLGVRKSVIDGSVDDQDNTLKGGAASIDKQFPTLGASANNTNLKGGTNQTSLKGNLTQEQLQRLANHDLVLIIDQSGSMHTPDCPVPGVGRVGGAVMGLLLGSAGMVSRWQWCRDQTMHLAEQTRYVSAKGLSVVLFSGTFVVFPRVTLDQIPQIFSRAAPSGGTNLTDPLRATIADYFSRKKATGGNVKPLAISIITDGRPNSESTVRQAIVEATYFMKDPREITITFFLIGGSALNGQGFIDDLQNNLTTRYGARYPIVRSVSFWNLTKVGLPRALADAIE